MKKIAIFTIVLSVGGGLLLGLISFFAYPKPASAALNDASGLVVGTTYYGGHYDGNQNKWVIDNKNQCDRIAAGEFTAASLNAVVDTVCDDDNGVGYINSIPLHNTVSFAELSTDYQNPNWAALGGLPAGSKLEIQYKGRCVIAEKRDVGQGGGPVNGYHRSLDLWWQTARTLGFYNGYDTMTIRRVDQSTPLSPLGSTSPCGATPIATSSAGPAPAVPQTNTPTSPAPKQSAQSSTTSQSSAASETATTQTQTSDNKTKPTDANSPATAESSPVSEAAVLNQSYTHPDPEAFFATEQSEQGMPRYLLLASIAILAGLGLAAWHRYSQSSSKTPSRSHKLKTATR